ncbi:GL26142 [Drosophila persimilis]|uniref:uncharacterized protein LOC4817912 n=2 Tax=pseudoobscura subgroup TaxID=32358 RepID=Q29PH2_DROPS|nr:uncharacterized protein LOC4817912 [Drosophila pseudoobscura]XP_002019035.1 uncharacterized protein LOC6593993 [Drosophila persimilis]EDW37231.1 GL26142 [Drosophila persimilis]
MIIPEVDMLAVSKNSRVQRAASAGYVLPGLKLVDYGGLDRVDRYYNDCQDYRDYYRDPYNKIHKPERFRHYQGKCGIRLDKSLNDLMLPPVWRVERKPIVYPIEYGIQMDMDKSYRTLLTGTHSATTHTAFKR